MLKLLYIISIISIINDINAQQTYVRVNNVVSANIGNSKSRVSNQNNASANQNPYLPYAISRTRNTLPLEPIIVKIIIPIGNYSIDSLLEYINSAIKNLYTVFNISFSIFGTTSPVLSKVQVNASPTFPVGYIQLSAHPNVYITMLSNILGFSGSENNFTPITSTNLYNLNPDLCLYLYFPNIPHKNTHFNNQLISFKIPVTSGYQSIEFNQENVNFAQYIELHDSTFILNKIELIIYDREGNYIDNNGYEFTFSLGIETE